MPPHVGDAIPAHRIPTLLAFFKRGCETSELAMPWVRRLQERLPSLQVRAIAQEPPEDVPALAEELGMPVVADPEPYPLSASLDLEVVPTLVLVAGGQCEAVVEGWNRSAFQDLAARAARLVGERPPQALGDGLPAFRPG